MLLTVFVLCACTLPGAESRRQAGGSEHVRPVRSGLQPGAVRHDAQAVLARRAATALAARARAQARPRRQ